MPACPRCRQPLPSIATGVCMACLWADEPVEIAGFEVERELGRGGMGRVYLARQSRLDRTVALKVIAGDALRHDQRRRFEREARLLARLVHPNIVTLHEYGESDGAPYLVMEHVDGGSLAGRTLPAREAVAVAIQVCDALACAHGAGIVHRDIKPSNILLDARGTAKVVDFGIARALGEPDTADLTRTGVVVGTPLYMAPELATGAIADARSDVYAVAVALFQLIAGRAPVGDLAVPLPGLEPILRRALAADPDARHQTATELGDALRRVSRRGRRWPIAAAALGCVGVAAVAVVALRGGEAIDAPHAVARVPDADARAAAAPDAVDRIAAPAGPDAVDRIAPAAPDAAVPDAARPTLATSPIDAAPRAAVPDAARPALATSPIDAAPRVAAADAPAVAPGTLVLRVRPWAMVAIDGAQVQRAEPPLARIVVPAGRHRIDLHNPTTERRWSETVDVPSGGEREVEADLR